MFIWYKVILKKNNCEVTYEKLKFYGFVQFYFTESYKK